MSKFQTLRGFINQRLSAAAEEIFELFERTIAEYEEQLCRSKEDQHKLLDAVYNPEVLVHRADTLQLLASTEEVPPDQPERSQSLDQEDKPEPPCIKEEQEEPWGSGEREQLHGPEEEEEEEEEADNRRVILTPVPVKRGEDDGEEPQFSQLYETQTEEERDSECLKTEADGEDCVEPEPEPDLHLQPVTDEETSHSESETAGRNCDLGEISDAQFSLNPLQRKEAHVSDEKYNTRRRSGISSEGATSSRQKEQAQTGTRIQRDEKPFSCSVCGKRFCNKKNLLAHKVCHTKSNRYNCTVCKKGFLLRLDLERHMRSHTGEKPYSCSVCSKSFTQKSNLFRHHQIHTREKPFSCSLCEASFRQKTHLARHTRVHTGEKPFSCSVCRKTFSERGTLQRHLTVHTKQKLFVCSACDRRFTRLYSLVRHKCKRIALS